MTEDSISQAEGVMNIEFNLDAARHELKLLQRTVADDGTLSCVTVLNQC